MCNIEQFVSRTLLRWIEVIDYIFTCMCVACSYIRYPDFLTALCETTVCNSSNFGKQHLCFILQVWCSHKEMYFS